MKLIGKKTGDHIMADDAIIGAEPVEASIGDFIGEQFDVAEASDIESSPAEEIRDRAEESAPQDEAVEVSAETDEVSAEPESQTATAPQSMSAKDREAFYTLPPESQQWISDRVKEQEADYTRKTMEVAEQRKFYEKLEQAIAPRRQQFAMNGMDDSTALTQLFALSDYAERDPVSFTRYLLHNRGIPLSALTDNAGVEPGDPQIVDLQQRLAAQENHLAQQNQQQLQQQSQVVTGVINDFAAAHPFYEELHDDMVPIVVTLKESKPGLSHDQYLDMAYKMAAAANESVSSKMEIDRRAQANAERVAKAKENAANARRAGGTNIQSTGTLPPTVAHSKNVDDFIGALVDERISA
jgi:hypothetical protein